MYVFPNFILFLSLQSTLVIFSLGGVCNRGHIGHFTIHSGYILSTFVRRASIWKGKPLQSTLVIFSLLGELLEEVASLFTIHSGYILSRAKSGSFDREEYLYNPLWLYSLVFTDKDGRGAPNFTIHSGYILSYPIDSPESFLPSLQSTLVIFSHVAAPEKSM